MLCLNGGAVSWKNSKQETMGDSTIESKYIATSMASKEVVWIKNLITELRVGLIIADPVKLYWDNNRATPSYSRHRRKRRCEDVQNTDRRKCR